MGKILIINGSPRAPKSNSKRYAEIFSRNYPEETIYTHITIKNHQELCQAMHEFQDVLFVFPLYADALPSLPEDLGSQSAFPETGYFHLDQLWIFGIPAKSCCHSNDAILLPAKPIYHRLHFDVRQRRSYFRYTL